MLLASAGLPARGFLWDYTTMAASATNFSFNGETYLITGPVNLVGETTLFGASVLKFRPSATATIYTTNIASLVPCHGRHIGIVPVFVGPGDLLWREMAYDSAMKALFGTLFLCIGFYFAAFSGGALVRTIGHPQLAFALDWLFAWSPFASILILLLVGFFVTLKEERRESRLFMMKLPLVCVGALVPLAVHWAIIKLTFAVDPPPPRVWGPLSVSKWTLLVLGCFLVGTGFFLLIRRRESTVLQA